MMNVVWAVLAVAGLCFAMAGAQGAEVSGTLLRAAMDAVSLAIRLAGGFAFWSGLIAILEDSGLARSLARFLARTLARLFPGQVMTGEAGQAISMNLTANLLGLGNAATPMGLRAMRLLGEEVQDGTATDENSFTRAKINCSLTKFPEQIGYKHPRRFINDVPNTIAIVMI